MYLPRTQVLGNRLAIELAKLFRFLHKSTIGMAYRLRTAPRGATYFKNLEGLQEIGQNMSKILRGVVAGYGAKKLGGGCFSVILIFIVLWWLFGNFDVFK